MYEELHHLPNDNNPWRAIQFRSVTEFCAPKTIRSAGLAWQDYVMELFSPDGSCNPDWFGCDNKQEFYEILDKGHPKYVKLVQDARVKVPPPKNLKRRNARGGTGDELDLQYVMRGNLDQAWKRRTPKVQVSATHVRLLVNIGQNANVTAQELKWTGVTALRLAEAFTEAGYNVAIDICAASRGVADKEHVIMFAPVKFYDQPLDIQHLTSCVCFTGFFRGPGFMNFGLTEGQLAVALGRAHKMKDLKPLIRSVYSNPAEKLVIIEDLLSAAPAQKRVEEVSKAFGAEASENPHADHFGQHG